MASNLPAVRQEQSLAVPEEMMKLMLAQADTYLKSGILPKCIKTKEQAVVVALQGRELGLPMMVALNNIYPINGAPMLSARLTLALIKRAGHMALPVEVSAEKVTYRFIRKEGHEYTYTVTYQEAVTGGWNKNPDGSEKFAWRNRKVMLANRCITQGAKLGMSDALLGFGVAEEDESLMVYDPEDGEYTTPDEMAHRQQSRERDHAPLAQTVTRGRNKLYKEDPAPKPAPAGEPVEAEYTEMEEPGEEPAPVQTALPADLPPQEMHWIDDATVRNRFWAFAGGLGLDEDAVHDALGGRVHDFKGTMADARKKLEQYATAQVAKMKAARAAEAQAQQSLPGVA